VVLPYLNGSDLNSDPAQQASRYIINFGEMPLRRAEAKRWEELTNDLRNESRKIGVVEPDYEEVVASDYPHLINLLNPRISIR